jgi:hypothetical protein
VRDADLTEDFDALRWLSESLIARGDGDAVGMITSRDLARFRLETACSGRISATCLATVGLTNAERVGTRLNAPDAKPGTINLAVITDAALTDTALIELSSIATQARTAAVMDHGPTCPQAAQRGPGPTASSWALSPAKASSQASIPRSRRPWAPPSTARWPRASSNGWPNSRNAGCPGANVLLHGGA